MIIPGCSCSCSSLYSAPPSLLGERGKQVSMPAMSNVANSNSSPKQPTRPSLKRRNSSAMIDESLSSSSSSSSSSSTTEKNQLSSGHASTVSLTNSKRNVSFTDISVREYDVELSDHPSCSYGPGLGLGWDYQEREPTTVEDYEITRSPRRNAHELVLSYNARKHRLKQSKKYNKQVIAAVEKEIDRIKRERMITEFFLPAMAIDETLERICEYVKQIFQRPAARKTQQRQQQQPCGTASTAAKTMGSTTSSGRSRCKIHGM